MNNSYQLQEIGEPARTINAVISDAIAFVGKSLNSVYLVLLKGGVHLTKIEQMIGASIAKIIGIIGTLMGIIVKLCIKVIKMVIKLIVEAIKFIMGMCTMCPISGIAGMLPSMP